MSEHSKLFGWGVGGLLDRAQIVTRVSLSEKQAHGMVLVVPAKVSVAKIKKMLPKGVPAWQLADIGKKAGKLIQLSSTNGPVVLLRLGKVEPSSADFGFHSPSDYQLARDLGGQMIGLLNSPIKVAWTICFEDILEESIKGFLVGLEIGQYKYLTARQNSSFNNLGIKLLGVSKACLAAARLLGVSVNVARHLVNTPANELNPMTFAKSVKSLFPKNKAIKIEVWNEQRLKKEKMGLILGVGKAASVAPRLLHIRYRPQGATGNPIAFVGKGITFDSGGLDLKPAAAMRLMKKDMGGAASIAGLAYWAIYSKLKVKLDFYFALAENSVGPEAYRPGDVLSARNGLSVEIHNTDAEGRLALADAMDVAVSQKGSHSPSLLIDVATLTGAARVGLGTSVGALFSTTTDSATSVAKAGQRYGDHVWPMPLYQGYGKTIRSSFADTNHCSSSRFGGAITAALFLKKFVGDTPWVHLDVMGWTEAQGPFRESGGNGQVVQCLAGFLEGLSE